MTEIEYRLMWTRTYLKFYGAIENSTRGVWSLTEKGSTLEKVDEKDVVHVVREQMKKNKQETSDDNEPNHKIEWQEELLDLILEMSPSAFERLIQRILRESGFVQVEVTGQSGDGGVDGHGILRLVDLLSFHVIVSGETMERCSWCWSSS
jgi:restriction system protein